MKTFLTNFGKATWGGIIILLADNIWLWHDILNNGISITYICVHIGFIVGYFLMIWGLHNHHKALDKKRANMYYTDYDHHNGD